MKKGDHRVWRFRAESEAEKHDWLSKLNKLSAILKYLDNFARLNVLGVGGQGIVYKLKHKVTGQCFALKEMKIANKKERENAVSEATLLKDLTENVGHPNILTIEKAFEVGELFYVLIPLCEGGELYEHVVNRGHFTEVDALKVIYDLAGALKALHNHDILHLDIKPENLLFDKATDDANIKLTDFGLSKCYEGLYHTWPIEILIDHNNIMYCLY